MSSRVTRTLLRLYPRRIRARYGEELLDLEDELTAHGEVSRVRLFLDMLTGALLIRHSRRRMQLASCAALVVVGLVVAGALIGGHGADPPARESPHRAQLVVRVTVAPFGNTCPVGGGPSCSVTPCTEFIDASLTAAVVIRDHISALPRRAPLRGAPCPSRAPAATARPS